MFDEASTVWWVAAGALLALELVTGTVYLLMLALGLVAGAAAAHAGLGLIAQMICAATLASVATFGLYRRKRAQRTVLATANPNVNLDVGEIVRVDYWDNDGTTRVNYRGSHWTAISRVGAAPGGTGLYRVVELQGNRLVLEPSF